MLQLSSFLAVKSSILHLWRWLQIILPSKLCAKAWDISRKLLYHPVWRKEGRCISTSDPMLREKMFESTGSSLPELSFIFTKGRGSRQDEQGCELNQCVLYIFYLHATGKLISSHHCPPWKNNINVNKADNTCLWNKKEPIWKRKTSGKVAHMYFLVYLLYSKLIRSSLNVTTEF